MRAGANHSADRIRVLLVPLSTERRGGWEKINKEVRAALTRPSRRTYACLWGGSPYWTSYTEDKTKQSLVLHCRCGQATAQPGMSDWKVIAHVVAHGLTAGLSLPGETATPPAMRVAVVVTTEDPTQLH